MNNFSGLKCETKESWTQHIFCNVSSGQLRMLPLGSVRWKEAGHFTAQPLRTPRGGNTAARA